MIPVTKPFLPPREEYETLLRGIWDREYLTNNGPLVQELEEKLKEYLGVPYNLFLTNGTIAIQIAIKALGLRGEIITTPFSYVATTSSIVWEDCTPVFVDIDAHTLNIDPALIEAAITEKTSAILATHVFGNPCDVDAIQAIADKHQLKVIYDAAHCFGTLYQEQSVFNFGDVSTTSFHATKLFHTIEGGAVFCKDQAVHERMNFMRNFGHDGFARFNGVGINGKNSEFHAAMGLANLKYIADILARRQEQVNYYYQHITDDHHIQKISIQDRGTWNYAYCPVIFDSEESTLQAIHKMEEAGIYPRRYFYPSLNRLPYVAPVSCPVSEEVSRQVLCLPLYHDLTEEEQEKVLNTL